MEDDRAFAPPHVRMRTEGDPLQSPLRFTLQVDDGALPQPPPGGTRDDIALVAAEAEIVQQEVGGQTTNLIAYEFVGVPEITPVLPSRSSPAGRDGITLKDVIAPPVCEGVLAVIAVSVM